MVIFKGTIVGPFWGVKKVGSYATGEIRVKRETLVV